MPNPSPRAAIAGTERKPAPHSRRVRPIQPDQQIEVTLVLRPGQGRAALSAHAAADDRHPSTRHYLTREELGKQFGASADDVAKIDAFAKANGLAVVETDPARRRVVLAGTAAAFEKAFDVQLHEYAHPQGTYRGREGTLSAPADIAPLIEGVFGLDDRAQATPKFQIFTATGFAGARVAQGFTPPQLAKLYDFPSGMDGSGQCIGIIELGGGFRPHDLETYFSGLGLPAPDVHVVSVDHGKNRPSTPDSADGEVLLDIEVAAAIAPKARIAVYFAPNTDRGFLDAVTKAIHDTVNKPSVISISWGAAEANWTGQAMTAFENAFTEAAAVGVTICCAAGDNGSTDGIADGQQHVDFPASAPHALACGGTRLVATATASTTETVWNENPNSATGGGYSQYFTPAPGYQGTVKLQQAGRGVPDVAGNADPATGYQVLVDGQSFVIGGTSAVAPLWAGLIALLNQAIGTPVGFLNPLLYGPLNGKGATNDITSGNNGAYEAQAGWDACTGWGSPNGQKLLAALQS